MTGLPKFVREQMARTAAPSSHPDADILTAFVEKSLSAKEYQQVVEHLSACNDCREIVFLAQPEAVENQTVLTSKPRRFTWMAWASVAAVVVVVASAVMLQREKVATTEAPVSVATATPALQPEDKPAAPPTTSAAAISAPAAKPRTGAPRQKPNLPAAKTKPVPEPLFTTKDIAANEERASMKAPAPAAVPPAIMTRQVIVDGVAPQPSPAGQAQRNIDGQAQTQGPSNTANNVNIAVTNETLAKAESAPAAKIPNKQRAEESHGLVAGYAAGAAAAPVVAVRVRWQISSTGTLERSYVAGNWVPVLTETGAKFHVVSVLGNTVWAGGEHGVLYVSRDGGATWNRMSIDTTSVITSVHFSDDSHGTVETADGQVWNTTDNGRTWQRH